MKKIISLILALALLLGVTAAVAEPTAIDGTSSRGIKINSAGLNPSADEMIAQNISPTTGRRLDEISVPDGFFGTVVSGQYQPIMVQISNAGNGIGVSTKGELYAVAPINGSYADVVYEACQKKGGGESRMTMIFSDTVPDYVGFVRSTRLTHPRIRQEWDCAFCTSGYSTADVPDEWARLGVPNPASPNRTKKDPGLVYVGDYPKVWSDYVWRLHPISDANSEVYELAKIVQNIVPKDHVPANHTFKFTDEIPSGGDSGEIIYVTFGNKYETDSRLEYNAANNEYIRYVAVKNSEDLPYTESVLVSPQIKKVKNSEGNTVKKIVAQDRVLGNKITFNNVIIQSIKMDWRGAVRPDPNLVGTGNADYFMGGKHLQGVWERKDDNSRTVFYDENGEEIELQRGRTLIILMDYSAENASVKYE